MARTRRTYTPEFKAEAVKLVTEQGYSVAEAARSLGLSENLIRNWKHALEDQGEHTFPGHGKLSPFEEENLLGRQFDPDSPNEAWVADITYIPTREGWLYLAAVEDLYSRRVVGWAMAEHMESRLVVDALAMAVPRRLPDEGLLAHSDRGSQYASEHYQRLLAKHGITCSMSR